MLLRSYAAFSPTSRPHSRVSSWILGLPLSERTYFFGDVLLSPGTVLKRKATCYIHQSAIYALPASGPGIRIQLSDVQQARHYASTFANISIEVVEFAGASGLVRRLATDGSLSIDRDAA
ncbi:hypothetical protein B0H14DRAFT_2613224 [Mycena olivaceomarginata]|nr:hypothetical protein B0H14DRAFT_2613224 [Mycena olivaceomarginata]